MGSLLYLLIGSITSFVFFMVLSSILDDGEMTGEFIISILLGGIIGLLFGILKTLKENN